MMSPSNPYTNQEIPEGLRRLKPSVAFVVLIFGALIAFEIFNYSTTDHALRDLLGDLSFAGIYWSTILAIAFCGIDFAGIARLFTPEQDADEPKEVWYLFGAWLLAATMNAILTWWGVAIAVSSHNVQSSAVIDPGTINSVVPVFVAIMVWVIRILIIGTLSLAMDRMIHPGAEQRPLIQKAMQPAASANAHNRVPVQSTQPMNIPASLGSAPAPRPSMSRAAAASARYRANSTADEAQDYVVEPSRGRPEPTYHSLGMSARPPVNGVSSENTGANRFRRS